MGWDGRGVAKNESKTKKKPSEVHIIPRLNPLHLDIARYFK